MRNSQVTDGAVTTHVQVHTSRPVQRARTRARLSHRVQMRVRVQTATDVVKLSQAHFL